jgi:hypothetical protein
MWPGPMRHDPIRPDGLFVPCRAVLPCRPGGPGTTRWPPFRVGPARWPSWPTSPMGSTDPSFAVPRHLRESRRHADPAGVTVWREARSSRRGGSNLGLVEACSVAAAVPRLAAAPTRAAGGAAPGRRPEGERAADAAPPCAPGGGS